jgi:hypothetical protein
MSNTAGDLIFVLIALVLLSMVVVTQIDSYDADVERVDYVVSQADRYPSLKPVIKDALEDGSCSRRELRDIEEQLRLSQCKELGNEDTTRICK